MWCSRRSFLALAALAAPAAAAGCGFRPLYAERTTSPAIQRHLAAIRVDVIADRVGQIVRNELADRLAPTGVSATPLYALQVRLTEFRQDLAIREDETATRANLILQANFTLRGTADPRPLHDGTAVVRNSYDILRNKFATITSEDDARTRSARQLAEEIRTRLAVFFERATSGAS